MTQNTQSIPNWWMYHGDQAHTGYIDSGSKINSANVEKFFKVLHEVKLNGSILSVPAIFHGYIYVGVANSKDVEGSNGGAFYKINIKTGEIAQTFTWVIPLDERDTHGFTGMGCTPAICEGKVYFSAFNAKLYCLDADSLELVWVTDLRYADLDQNQPVTNDMGMAQGDPPAAGWSSPVVVKDKQGKVKVYVGIGEGENPFLYSFVFCLDGQTGKVIWIFCTCKFEKDKDNQPNVLPGQVVRGKFPSGFRLYNGNPVTKGSSVWSSIAYDPDLNRLYCATGNPVPDGPLPTPGYSNGVLALDADSGAYQGFVQIPSESSYRPTDYDVDIGASPTLFVRKGKKVVGIGCKNGCYMIADAESLECLEWRQLLPYYQDGRQIPTVDPHPPEELQNELNPRIDNEVSNKTIGENYFGTYSTAAIHPGRERLFIGMGGPNYHNPSTGIDYTSTPFMRALDWNSLEDAWPMGNEHDPPRYRNSSPPMYTTAGECGLSSPAVVNDLVFCSTSKVSLYAFDIEDGRLLWQDDLGVQTGGYNGGYGACMGPAIWGNYVVAGALIYGRDGGILKIYGLCEE